MISSQNIANHELIGLHASVIESTNSETVGISGYVCDETKHMLTLQTAGGVKILPKQHNKWRFTLSGQDIIIDGNIITKRPEDRIKVKI